MIIEQEICRRVAEVLQGLLPEVEVNGNWLPDPGGLPKGAGGWPGAKLTVSERDALRAKLVREKLFGA